MSSPVPPFGPVSARKLVGLARRIAEAESVQKAESQARAADVPSWELGKLAWHMVAHGLIAPGNPNIIDALGEEARGQPGAVLLAAAARLEPVPPPTRGPASGPVCLLERWARGADALLFAAHKADPDGLAALLPGASPELRLGIQLVRGRCGERLPEEDRRAILDALAAHGTTLWNPPTRGSGESISLRIAGPGGLGDGSWSDLTALALCFGSEEEWTPRYQAALDRARFHVLQPHIAGFRSMDLGRLFTAIAAANLVGGPFPGEVRAILADRAEPTAEILAAILARPEWYSVVTSTSFLVFALDKLAQEGGVPAAGTFEHRFWPAAYPPTNPETLAAFERVRAHYGV